MSLPKDWTAVFTSTPKKESETPSDYYHRVGQKIGIKGVSVKSQYLRWKGKTGFEEPTIKGDFTSFSKQYVMPDGNQGERRLHLLHGAEGIAGAMNE